MVLDDLDLLTFTEWFFPGDRNGELHFGALTFFLLLVPIASLLAALACYFLAAFRRGPVEGFYAVARTVADAVSDAFGTSPRRTLAIARLAIHEAIRRRVLVVFAIFMAILLFAGWFLDAATDNPARLYLSFVLTSTNLLVLVLGLVLSTFSIPNDIKNRTIHTVMTKPVRASEIVLGRMVGFIAVGTLLVLLMCLVSYIFVRRGLSHVHVVRSAALGQSGTWTGETSDASGHSHKFESKGMEQAVKDVFARELSVSPELVTSGARIKDLPMDADQLPQALARVFDVDVPREAAEKFTTVGDAIQYIVSQQPLIGRTDTVAGHSHELRYTGEGRFEIGPPQDQLQARVPSYGTLRFLDRNGQIAKKANVGNEWDYRGYLQGGGNSSAVWTFKGLNRSDFPDGLTIELSLRVFRTQKGDFTKGILGSLELRNPDVERRIASAPKLFYPTEYSTDVHYFAPELDVIERDGNVRPGNLFDDLINEDGNLEVVVRCLDPAQYFGMARADVYIRANDASFAVNFCKGFTSIWLQMVLVICFGVMLSTFLSGPVAMIATFGCIILGFCGNFVSELAAGIQKGGGPLESLIRLVTQRDQMTPLESTWGVLVIQRIDQLVLLIMQYSAQLLPNYARFSTSSYVASGFDIYNGLLGRHCLITLAYVLATAVVGYFFLKTREVAA